MSYIYWGLLTGIFIVVEIAIPALVSVWFAISAFIVMLLSFFITDIKIQILIFTIISIALMLTTQKWVKKTLNSEKNSNVGDEVTVIKKIEDNKYEIRYKGGIWTAISNENFDEKEKAFIKEYKGNKIIIERR
ncbi:NfeD family protein [Oceanivirga salmonicida]|uniref:NfeD family protein n=1 Tax=Oceanivirga salmonicida TaxID=1769291 RepID=UPI000829B18A|nr:NfeD family protein [Oceanivirga salmonicida]